MIRKFVLSALLAALAVPAAAQAPLPDADPALLVVRDDDTTIYMFGTFHMLDGKRDWFNDEVKTAFDASQEVVLEAIPPEDQASLLPLVQKYAVDPKGKTLSSKLPAAVKVQYDKALGDFGVPEGAFEQLEPWFASMALVQVAAQKIGLTGEHGPEGLLARSARAAGKPIGELEGFEYQLGLFDAMPEAQQVAMLKDTVESMAGMGETLTPMLNAWSSGQTESLVALMNQSLADDPELYSLLFSKRNAAWADWIGKRLEQPGTVFLAVGAGHLAGKDSVPELLARRGIRTARVPK